MIARVAAAIALAALALPARAADPLGEAESELGGLESRIAALEAALTPPEEGPSARAARRFAAGEARFARGDFAGAAAALAVAVDEPAFRAGPQLGPALWQLGESLYRLGRPAAALARFRELLKLDGAPFRREALPRAMDCALRLGRPGDATALLDAARQRGDVPPEALYLAAKAAYQRTDRAAADRLATALAAFAQVPPPFQLHAAYFEGAIRVDLGQLAEAEAAFGRCAAQDPRDAAQGDVHELCRLALARLAADAGRWADADRHYREIARRSPRFAEALQEHAGAAIRAGKLDEAVRLAGLLPELRPESPLAPRSALLRGQLQLRMGKPDEAVANFARVVATYAPLRDELDRALAAGGAPSRWSAALAGAAPGGPAEPALPRIALRWARDRDEVQGVLALAREVEAARRDLAEARRHAERVEGMLSRNYGLGAFPPLEEGYARAEAIENGALRASAIAAAALSEALAPHPGGPVGVARTERREAQAKASALPTRPEEMAARQRRERDRLAALGKQVVELRGNVAALATAAEDVEIALSARPGALAGDRAGLEAELAGLRSAVAQDLAGLEALAARVARASDGTPRACRTDEDAVRATLRNAIDKELELATRAAPGATPPERATRANRVLLRASEVESRADRAKREILREARVRAAQLRQELKDELARLAAEGTKLDALRADADRTVGRAAKRVFRDVRAQLHAVVLQADVGAADVAWAAKQRSLAAIQAESAKTAAELKALEGGRP